MGKVGVWCQNDWHGFPKCTSAPSNCHLIEVIPLGYKALIYFSLHPPPREQKEVATPSQKIIWSTYPTEFKFIYWIILKDFQIVFFTPVKLHQTILSHSRQMLTQSLKLMNGSWQVIIIWKKVSFFDVADHQNGKSIIEKRGTFLESIASKDVNTNKSKHHCPFYSSAESFPQLPWPDTIALHLRGLIVASRFPQINTNLINIMDCKSYDQFCHQAPTNKK